MYYSNIGYLTFDLFEYTGGWGMAHRLICRDFQVTSYVLVALLVCGGPPPPSSPGARASCFDVRLTDGGGRATSGKLAGQPQHAAAAARSDEHRASSAKE
jgi:hypothetical protein